MPLGSDSYLRAVREKYNAIEIWPSTDRWLAHVKTWIAASIAAWQPTLGLTPASRVLNAGSGDESYNVSPGLLIDCDIAEKKLANMPCGVAGDLANLPLKTGSVDVCVCVGSVVNYVGDLPKAIAEIARVVKGDGRLILEFESSRSPEYMFTAHFGQDVSQVSTFYIYENENIWVYAEEHVRRLLAEAGFEVVAESRTHFVAPMIYRFKKSLHYAARFARFDKYVSWIPGLNKHSANVIYLCQRRGKR
ncbi:MAG: methyltransferase domain-containing protein [Rhodospirillales bacterium]|nr:methyltransferase domain-containing protein [Rhodospirillales bacterium]